VFQGRVGLCKVTHLLSGRFLKTICFLATWLGNISLAAFSSRVIGRVSSKPWAEKVMVDLSVMGEHYREWFKGEIAYLNNFCIMTLDGPEAL